MSSYAQGPPPDLSALLGGGGGGPGPIGPPGGGGQPPDQPGPDNPKVEQLVDHAADLLKAALEIESDPEDKALIAKMIAEAHKFTGAQQKLVDTATGAGPGAKLVRKATAQGAGYGG